MSNPEKRDERSMSDILASIRKIMAQEPALAVPPNAPRPSLNGVSGATLDLPREPELKLPAEKKPSEGMTPPAPSSAAEPVSLDELLAETPRATPPPTAAPTVKPAPAGATPASGTPSAEAPEWLFPKPSADGPSKDKPLPVPPQARDMDAKSSALPAIDSQSASPVGKTETPEEPKAARESAPPSPAIGPPAPRLGDLGSVVPGKLDGAGPQPTLAVGPPPPGVNGERSVLGPPLAGPLLGEPTRSPAASEPLPEVPGADALRRLIADVVPPSAHPSLAPIAKAPDPAAAKTADAAKPDGAAKPAPEIKAEAKVAPTAPPEAKKPEASTAPAPASAPVPKSAAAAPAPKPAAAAPAPTPKPTAPVPAQKAEAPAPAPAAKPTTSPAAAKTMDETVVELLRPLLREWLNTNMPRLIEPALKAEIEALRNAVAKEKKD